MRSPHQCKAANLAGWGCVAAIDSNGRTILIADAHRDDGKRFIVGDRRINRRGRPRNFDAFRELCQKICHERVTLDGEVMTRLEVILRDWAESKDAQKQIALIQYGYGKPVDKIETNLAPTTVLRLHYAHEMPGWRQPDGPIIAVNGEGTLRPLLPDAD